MEEHYGTLLSTSQQGSEDWSFNAGSRNTGSGINRRVNPLFEGDLIVSRIYLRFISDLSRILLIFPHISRHLPIQKPPKWPRASVPLIA